MITRQEVFEGIYGAWRLLLLDKGAVALFDDSIPGFWKSFFAAALVFPIYALLAAFGPIAFESSRSFIAIALIYGEFYVIRWVLWPLIVGYLAPALDRDEKYPLYVVAYNWAGVIRSALLLGLFLMAVFLPLSAAVLKLIGVVAWVALLAYHVFIIRTTLDVQTGPALGLAIFEFIVVQIMLSILSFTLA